MATWSQDVQCLLKGHMDEDHLARSFESHDCNQQIKFAMDSA